MHCPELPYPAQLQINSDSGKLTETMFHKLKDETNNNPELQQLQKVVMSGWPETTVDTSRDKALQEAATRGYCSRVIT